jgi:hypothetical protein
MQLSQQQRDDAVLAILKLDPLSRHSHPDVSAVRDLRRLWTAAEAVASVQPKPVTDLLRLNASADALAKQNETLRQQLADDIDIGQVQASILRRNAVTSPAAAIARTAPIAALRAIMRE